MVPLYGSTIRNPSSSNVESSFKILKKYLFRLLTKSDRLRVDSFIIKHSEFIEGEIKTASNKEKSDVIYKKKDRFKESKAIKRKAKKDNDYSDDSIFSKNPKLIENWKGYGIENDKKKAKKPMTYVPLLQNGILTRSGIKNLILRNTCAFDSVTQVFAAACADGFAVKADIFTNNTNNFCAFVKDMLDNKKSKLDLYKHRARILESCFDKKEYKDLTEIFCNCSVTHIFEKMLMDVIYSAGVKETCTNESCPVNNVERKIAFLKLDTNKTDIAEAAAAMLTEENNVVTCRRKDCQGIRTFTHTLHNVISLELSQNQYKNLKDIPLTMTLQSKQYDILGIIEYVPSGPNEDLKSIGHYRTHCYRQKNWIYFDDLKNRTRKSQQDMIMHCVVYGEKIND